MAKHLCPTSSSRLTIDLGAIRDNYRLIAARIAPAMCSAVVKADAYGLGAARVAPMLRDAGCGIFFVAQLGEAIALREALGAGSEILILNGVDPGGERLCADHGLIPVLNSLSQVERWRTLARERGTALPAALQVDSGMSRLGLDARSVATLADDAAFPREVSLRLLMTHLACADAPGNSANEAQLARFALARARFPGVPASIANSGGSFLPEEFHCDVARPGIALYGVAPSALAEGLRPVATLAARVIQIREIEAGTGVGYGLDYIASERRRLATVGIGYADGWPRHLSNVGAVWHQGTRLPITGRVSMDSLTVDISALPDEALAEGDFVELLGPSQTLDDVAGEAGTIAYEILTQLGRRHERRYVDGAQICA
ncbi:alanine racemase [Sphingomonas sp. MMSM20]|uniref:alanine racemase n=1 Tax=Sphingomonas lycopersici TaxID=2951807 RepID=UPI002238901C|nr:alanine racemase [Sphingomonas lycopersici]MCW6529803.1 alanine racemase [Sphingomonas lycopersici]